MSPILAGTVTNGLDPGNDLGPGDNPVLSDDLGPGDDPGLKDDPGPGDSIGGVGRGR
jgi:hypothetical protein